MKNYEDMTRDVFKRIDEYEEKKKRQQIVVRKIAVLVPAACLTLFIGVFSLKKVNIIPEVKKSTGQCELVELVTSESSVSNTVTSVLPASELNINSQTKPSQYSPATAGKTSLTGSEPAKETLKPTEKISDNAVTPTGTVKETSLMVTHSDKATEPSESSTHSSSEVKDTPVTPAKSDPPSTSVYEPQPEINPKETSQSNDHHKEDPFAGKNISQIFNIAELSESDLKYRSTGQEIDASEIGEYLSDAEMKSDDDFLMGVAYTGDAKAYIISGKDPESMIAVKLVDSNDIKYYLYLIVQ